MFHALPRFHVLAIAILLLGCVLMTPVAAWAVDADGDGYAAGASDCNDADPDIYPGAPEWCNTIDDNCDNDIDEDEAIDAEIWYGDNDIDTYGNMNLAITACSQPSGYVSNYTDCNDASAGTHPGVTEGAATCDDGLDNDCSCFIVEWTKVANGFEHVLALDSQGQLWTWGWNYYGQLGVGYTSVTESSPLRVRGDGWAEIGAGRYLSGAIKSDGTLWAWGYNFGGMLGTGSDHEDKYIPVQIGTDTDWSKISVGADFFIALKTDGSIWGWGNDGNGQTGIGGGSGVVDTPTLIDDTDTWVKIAASSQSSHAHAINSNGELFAWGSNNFGQLAVGDYTERHTPTQEWTSATNWAEVSAGGLHGLGLKTNGELYSWGDNRNEQMGIPEVISRGNCPGQVGTDTDWNHIAGGNDHSAATKTDGTLYRWGTFYSTKYETPTQVGSATDWADISVGGNGTMALKDDGELWGHGGNSKGNLGNGNTANNYSYTGVQLDIDNLSSYDACATNGDLSCDDVDNDGDGYTENEGDCDDTSSSVKPGIAEVCGDGIDNNCANGIDEENGTTHITWYQDLDSDGYGTNVATTSACAQPIGYGNTNGDCNDASAGIHPGATEVCGDGIDNNCANGIDEESGTSHITWYRDVDGDGYGVNTTTNSACAQPTGYVSGNNDCNDGDTGIHPSATEICGNGIDENCTNGADEESGTTHITWYRDADSDSYGSNTTTTSACGQPAGYLPSSGDCNDNQSIDHPGATELCDARDNDCDGTTNEGMGSIFNQAIFNRAVFGGCNL